MASDDDLVLSATRADGSGGRVSIDVQTGGRLRQITAVAASGDEARLFASSPSPTSHESTGWGSYPMAPWAGRIRHGRFDWLGEAVQLETNFQDVDAKGVASPQRRHAIHGTTFFRPWTIVASGPDRAELTCALDGALGWPFAGVARQVITIGPEHLDLSLSVEPAAGVTLPATIGWHPWFAKPDRVDVQPLAMYELDDIGIPTGRLVAPGEPPWDDCFIVHEPIRLHYIRPVAPVVTVSSADCDHWVIYDMPHHATCVEPQSGPPDGPTVRPELTTSARPLRRTMRIAW